MFAGGALAAFIRGGWLLAMVIPLLALGGPIGLALWLRRRLAPFPLPIGIDEDRIEDPVRRRSESRTVRADLGKTGPTK